MLSATSTFASVVFYTDKASFDAATTTSTVDFGGIVGDTQFLSQGSHVIDGVTFTADPATSHVGGNATICGKDACSGLNHGSAVFVADTGSTMVIELPTGITAAGGLFADLDSWDSFGVFSVYGSSGLLDARTVSVGRMRAGESTFLGWSITGNDVITRLEFYLKAADLFTSLLLQFKFEIIQSRSNISLKPW